jgi:hypothetical protein
VHEEVVGDRVTLQRLLDPHLVGMLDDPGDEVL